MANNDDKPLGVLSDDFTNSFFKQQENNGYGATELIKAGKTDRPDDQLLRTIFDSDTQARACASMLARARRFNVKPANEFCTFYMEAKVSVKGMSRQQYLQGLTMTYDYQSAQKLWDSGANKKKADPNSRPIMPGD